MKVKPVNPELAAGLIDPVTRRSPFIDPMTKAILDSAEVPENVFWGRRLRAGEIERVEDDAPATAPAPAPTAQPVGEKPASHS